MCFFGGGGGGAPGPQSSADKANGGYTPPRVNQAVQNQQTADKNTMRRAGDSNYKVEGTNTTAKKTNNAVAVASGQKTMNALNDYNKTKTKKTILGS